MSTFLDIIGSILIAGCVILIGLRLTLTANGTGTASTATATVLEQMAATQAAVEADIKNIGFGLPDPSLALAIADSNRIRFRADMDQDGDIDSVEWYLGKTLSAVTDRTLRILCRRYNGRTDTVTALGVSRFSLSYLDRTGQPTNVKASVALIEVTLGLSSLYKVADQVNPDSMVFVDIVVHQGMVATPNIARHG